MYADVDIETVAECDYTQVHLTGIPKDDQAPDSLFFRYSNLLWESGEWVERDTTEKFVRNASDTYRLMPIYAETSLLSVWDADPDTTTDSHAVAIISDYPIPDLQAYTFRMTARTETRGKSDEKTNEANRPVHDSIISGLSAPFTVLFDANPTPRVNYIEWRIQLGSSLATTPRHDRTFRYTFTGAENAQAYTVKLHCKGVSECERDTQRVAVSVTTSRLLVPNVFTPNGDSRNDEFRVMYQSLSEFHIWVYNRWGKEVYSSSNPDAGWDGYIGGRPAAEGAYFYVVRAKGTDGQEYKMGGDINLIRGK